ncbi:Redoxin domain protein [Arcobacter nitrofigilis DSM 7299]|uniref:Redoxin domain protein n=1 Tax=Arcobacter nitrofigilis (strain ATCC 33309 / DSM 7299 / CCUG 15893 / LMG 7604 / NCTC 12251 / CI) TaxID=572480 RepID=D5V4T1_ARCNC|nr:TlpA disulfide reductase family protein [Arcobacter nitrofigilis]ADG92986.1 Redoxin domain protein [Arcobacter nitrofigilis DSM 7299]
MKYFLLLLTTLFLFTGCDEDAKTVIKDSPSFNELKEKKNEDIYNLVTTQGKKISLEYSKDILTSKDLNGKIILINFFATWCPPCKEELPVFAKLTEKYPNDFEVVSILFKDEISKSDLEVFMKKYKMNFPVTVGGDNERLAKDINNIQKIPESYLFTKDGVLIDKFIGPVNEQALENLIIKLKDQK